MSPPLLSGTCARRRFPLSFLGLLSLIFTLGSLAPLNAQDYQIDWYTIDAGGGTSQGADYQLSGTIGQPDSTSTPLTGGPYTVTGGFWAGWTLSISPERPALLVQPAAGGIILSWTVTTEPLPLLEETDQLGADGWRSSPVENGAFVPASDRTRFFRLAE